MKKPVTLTAQGSTIGILKVNGKDDISLTDIARQKNAEFHANVVRNWMRSEMTVAFLGLFRRLYNPDSNLVEFDQLKDEVGTNAFVLPPQEAWQW